MPVSRNKPHSPASLELPFDPDNLTLPDANNASRRRGADRGAGKGKANARTKNVAAGPNPQPFLPGLSRRGRPRSQTPVSASDRAAASRGRRLAEGAKRVELMLDAETLSKLDAVAAHLKESHAGALRLLIARAAARLLK